VSDFILLVRRHKLNSHSCSISRAELTLYYCAAFLYKKMLHSTHFIVSVRAHNRISVENMYTFLVCFLLLN